MCVCVCVQIRIAPLSFSLAPTKTVIILENGFIDRSKISLVDKHTKVDEYRIDVERRVVGKII